MPKVVYSRNQAKFFMALKKETDAFFDKHQISKSGNWKLYSKSALLIISSMLIYISLMVWTMPSLLAIALCGILGFILALIGFNIMHDACHGSYSDNKKVNEIMGYSLNMIGGNSFLWKQKHNVLHHTYTNIDGMDDDIGKSPLIRMCKSQKWVAAHRVQHIYIFFLYALSSIFWIMWQDFRKYFTKRVYTTKLPDMSPYEHTVFWVSKAFFVIIYLILPIWVHGWLATLVGFLVLHIVLGLTTTVVFQLAHVVEETEFNHVGLEDELQIENEWAVHQVKSTANFSPNNKIITFLTGGLNYQIEHHLFPHVSHVHYPALSKIVKNKCEEFGLPYLSSPSFFQALASHYKLIRQLGMNP